MAEYVPAVNGPRITRKASAAITGGQLVYVSGDGTVAPTTAATVAWLGIAGADTANGDIVTVYTENFQRAIASGAITAGDALESAAGGKVAKHTVGTNDYLILGVALNTVADGGTVQFTAVR